METYEQKVERVAKAIYCALAARPEEAWDRESDYHRGRYQIAAKDALEEEARDIEPDLSEPESSEPKPKRKRKRKLTLPLTVNQRVVTKDGRTGYVSRMLGELACVEYGEAFAPDAGDGPAWGHRSHWYYEQTDGKFQRSNMAKYHPLDLVADA